jgi:SanA protein
MLWLWWVEWHYSRFIYAAADLPPERVAIVFGARVYPDGRLSAMLRDRVDTAVQLYQAGKVQKLLLSGDNSVADYNEPAHMQAHALQQGVPAEDIQLDYAGRRTYDTCYRARAIFGLQSAVLVTQEFHLPRALFTCRSLGVETVGVAADLRIYHPRSLGWSKLREAPATLAALLDVIRRQPAAILGDPIPIR